MAWPAAVLPCFISRFLYRPHSAVPIRVAWCSTRRSRLPCLKTGCLFSSHHGHALARTRTLSTIERTCPAGASWCLPHGRVSGVERYAYDPADRGFERFRSLNFSFLGGAMKSQHGGSSPPARRGREGAFQPAVVRSTGGIQKRGRRTA